MYIERFVRAPQNIYDIFQSMCLHILDQITMGRNSSECANAWARASVCVCVIALVLVHMCGMSKCKQYQMYRYIAYINTKYIDKAAVWLRGYLKKSFTGGNYNDYKCLSASMTIKNIVAIKCFTSKNWIHIHTQHNI